MHFRVLRPSRCSRNCACGEPTMLPIRTAGVVSGMPVFCPVPRSLPVDWMPRRWDMDGLGCFMKCRRPASMACAKLNDLEGHFQRVRGYLRHSMLDPNLLPGVFVHASEYVGGLVHRGNVEL